MKGLGQSPSPRHRAFRGACRPRARLRPARRGLSPVRLAGRHAAGTMKWPGGRSWPLGLLVTSRALPWVVPPPKAAFCRGAPMAARPERPQCASAGWAVGPTRRRGVLSRPTRARGGSAEDSARQAAAGADGRVAVEDPAAGHAAAGGAQCGRPSESTWREYLADNPSLRARAYEWVVLWIKDGASLQPERGQGPLRKLVGLR